MPSSRRNALVVHTAEGVEFSLLLAGPVARFLAWCIDIACISLVAGIAGSLLRLFSVISLDLGMALVILGNFIIAIGYGIVCEWYWRGQTLGKRVVRLRVVDQQGLRLQFSQVVVRNLLRVVDMLPLLYMAGGIACLMSGKSQRLGDMAAGTIVVRTTEYMLPSLERLARDKYNSLAEHPRLAAKLRQKAGRDVIAIAQRALLRRDELEASARVALFGELAEHFRSLVKFPHEAVAGLTDERYVWNVVDLMFGGKERGRLSQRAQGGTDKP